MKDFNQSPVCDACGGQSMGMKFQTETKDTNAYLKLKCDRCGFQQKMNTKFSQAVKVDGG